MSSPNTQPAVTGSQGGNNRTDSIAIELPEGETGDGETDDGGSEEEVEEEEEEGDGEGEEDEESVEAEKSRYSFGLVILNYLQYLNVLSDEALKEALKHICPFEYDLIYTIMGVYTECAKGNEITIDDRILTSRVDRAMNNLDRVKAGGKSKRNDKIFREPEMQDVIRKIIAHFVGDPTLIFQALVTYEK